MSAEAELPASSKNFQQTKATRIRRLLRPFDKGKRSTGIYQVFMGGNRLLALGREPKAYLHMAELWDTGAGKLLTRFDARSRGLLASLSADGTRIVVEQDGKLVAFETGKMKPLWECVIPFTRPAWLNGLALAKDGTRIFLTGGDPFTLAALDGKTGKSKWSVTHRDSAVLVKRVDLELAHDAKVGLLATTAEEDVVVWLQSTGEIKDVFRLHDKKVEAASISADGKIALTGSADGTVKAWEVKNGRQQATWSHEGSVAGLALSNDGKLAISCGAADRKVILRQLPSGKELDSFDVSATKNHPASATFSADTKAFFLGLSGGAIFEFELI